MSTVAFLGPVSCFHKLLSMRVVLGTADTRAHREHFILTISDCV